METSGGSHTYSLDDNPSFIALRQFLAESFARPADEAAGMQREFERKLHEHVRRMECDVHAAYLPRLDVSVPGLVVGGQRYRQRKEKEATTIMTLAGPVPVLRTVYEPRGGHGGPTLSPLEMRLGLVDGQWTPEAASLGASYMAAVPSKEAAMLLARSGNMSPSASHLDRLPKHFNEFWEAHRQELEAAVRLAETEQLPNRAAVAVIGISLDGVMVPVKNAPPAPSKVAAEEDDDEEGEARRAFREAGCGTVSLFDARGERLHTVRFARMPEAKKVVLKQQLKDELRRMIEIYPGVPLQGCADGAKENWRIIDEIAAELGVIIERTLDYFHAKEHLDDALTLHASSDPEQARHDIEYFGKILLEDPKGVDRVIQALYYRVKHSSGQKKERIRKQLNYFCRHKSMMKYQRLRAKHWPIGSGIQEAACKTLAVERMKQSGMSWGESGGQAVLTLRGLEQSGRWSIAWDVLHKHLASARTYNIDQDTSRQRPRRPERKAVG